MKSEADTLVGGYYLDGKEVSWEEYRKVLEERHVQLLAESIRKQIDNDVQDIMNKGIS